MFFGTVADDDQVDVFTESRGWGEGNFVQESSSPHGHLRA